MEDDSVKKKLLKAQIKEAIEALKSTGRAQVSVDELREQAKKFPDLKKLINELERVEREAQEREAKILVTETNNQPVYSEEERAYLLKQENDYFEKNKELHEIINKMNNGARINDNDPTGNSITTEAATESFTKILNNVIERNKALELITHDLGHKSKEEAEREREAKKRADEILSEELYAAIYEKHKQIHEKAAQELAQQTGNPPAEIKIEEIVKSAGNQIIDEVSAILPKIREAFKGAEDKLSALLFHNPKALHENHSDIAKLRDEAEKAHKQQKHFETSRVEEKKEKEHGSKKSGKHTKIVTSTGEEKLGGIRDRMKAAKTSKQKNQVDLEPQIQTSVDKDEKNTSSNRLGNILRKFQNTYSEHKVDRSSSFSPPSTPKVDKNGKPKGKDPTPKK